MYSLAANLSRLPTSYTFPLGSIKNAIEGLEIDTGLSESFFDG